MVVGGGRHCLLHGLGHTQLEVHHLPLLPPGLALALLDHGGGLEDGGVGPGRGPHRHRHVLTVPGESRADLGEDLLLGGALKH